MSRRVELVFILFLFSGFGGLIYESVWTHYLKLFLGHSAYAQTLVLVVFIGGLALGAWICARLSHRFANPLRWYAAVELLVGVIALVFHPIFVAVTDWGYASLLPAACEASQPFCAAQWAVSALLLLPQSILIGATFPLVSSAVLRMDPSLPGHHIALLYFLNSLGAVFGVLASIFLLIPAFGLPGTLTFAGCANIALALAAFALSRTVPAAFDVPPMAGGERGGADHGPRLLPLLLATAFLTGLSSFVYEIVWIRMLSLVLGASTHSFELMLASFILGLALGGLWVRQRVDSVTDPVRFLGVVQIVMGVAAAATLPLYNASFDLMAWLLSSVSRNAGGFVLFNLASTGIALLVMLPATFCAGMTLPLITYRLLRTPSGERALGLVYSVNTVGAIVGVMLGVHVLMEALGMRGALLVGAAIDVVLGVVLILSRRRRGEARTAAFWSIPAGVAALAIVAVAVDIDVRRSSSGVFRTGAARIAPGSEVIFHRDGKTATVDVLDDGQVRAIRTNGKTDAAITMGEGREPTGDQLTMALLSVLPLAHNPGAKTAAIIGFGSGMSTEFMLGSPHLERVDTIEIEPAMVQGARLFRPVVKGAFDDPRSHIVIDDAKSYFARGRSRYDIIVSEPSNPWVSGVSSLFTEQFYRRLSDALNDGGVLSQWLHTYEMDSASLASILAAVAKTFPEFVVYSSIDSDIILIARKGGAVGAPDGRVLAWPGLAPTLDKLKLRDVELLHRRGLGTSHSLQALFRSAGVPANSDYFPLVDQRTSRTRFTQERVAELAELQAAAVPMLEMLDGSFAASSRAIDSRPWALADRAAADAWGVHDLIVGLRTPAGASPGPDSREHSARLIALWAARCDAGIPFNRLVPSLVNTAQVVNPHLAREPASQLWARVAASPCAARLTPFERALLDLFAAVGRRDAAAMVELGAAVLDATAGSRSVITEYAFIATVTGLVCQGRMQDAAGVLERGTRDWLVPGSRTTELRFLHALATDPAAASAVRGPACRGGR
ncbi:MAG TPA: fused MFS/spermidine synthase [Usitatibacter sp.]|nr:fused MFS/spermidine synthase [Usitatibacter sp.]